MTEQTVSIYGYGRFGKFWADILAENFRVKVYSRRGLQPDEVSPGLEICDKKEIFSCDALFFCVAISSFEEVLIRSRPFCREKTVFFDTCSVKVLPSRWMRKHLPEGTAIIATHPMFGPDSYNQTSRKLPMVMCNVTADTVHFEKWAEYFTSKSLQVERMSPEEHDEMTAYSQGITHYVGRVLADLELRPTPIDTHGYKVLLDIIKQTCNDSRQLFLDLQNYNPYAGEMLDRLAGSIGTVRSALAENDKDLLVDN